MKNLTVPSGLGLTAVPPTLYTRSWDRDGRRDGASPLGLPEVAKRHPRRAHRAVAVILVLVGSVTAAAALGAALQSRPALHAR